MSNSNIDIAVKWSQVGEQIAKDAATAIQTIGKHATEANTPLNALSEISSELGLNLKTLAGFGAIGVIAEVGKHALEAADHLEQLHLKTGISLGDLQALQYAGAKTGLGLDQLTTGVNQLQRRLIEDGPEANAALHALGLNAVDLVAMDPHDMLIAVSDALQKIEDPAMRSAVAIELLGKSGTDFLPLLLQNVQELEAGAKKMSDRQIADLARLNNAWQGFKTNLGTEAGQIIGDFGSIGGAAARMWQLIVPGADLTRDGFQALDDLHDEVEKQVDGMGKAAEKTLKWGESATTVKRPLSDLLAISKDLTEQGKKATEVQEKHTAAIDALKAKLQGDDVAAKVRDLTEAVTAMVHEGLEPATFAMPELIKQLEDWEAAGVPLPPVLLDIWAANVSLGASFGKVHDGARDLIRTFPDLTGVLKDAMQATVDTDVAINSFGSHVKVGSDLHSFLKDFPDLTPGVKRAWHDDIEEPARQAELAHQHFMDFAHQEEDKLVGAIGHGWSGLKSSLGSIFSDIEHEFETKLVRGMIDSMLTGTNQMGQMFSGIFSGAGGGGGAGGAGGGAGGSTVPDWVSVIPLFGLLPMLSVKSDREAEAAKARVVELGGVPDTIFGLGQKGYSNWDIIGNLTRQAEFLTAHGPQTTPFSQAQRDWLRDHPGYKPLVSSSTYTPTPGATGGADDSADDKGGGGGQLLQFSKGTGGEYVDFGTGTLAVLHGKERVMTEAEGGGGVNISIAFGDIHTGGSPAEARDLLRIIKGELQSAFTRGEFQIPARAVRPVGVGG